MKSNDQKAAAALAYVIPLLESCGLAWVITGGFASYVYGAKRSLTDIDIDVDASKDDPRFQKLMKGLADRTTQPLEHFVDQNYDNYNFEATIDGVVIDICPMAEMNVFNKKAETYEHFYKDGFPAHEVVRWNGMALPLLSKELIIKNKEMLAWQRESDLKDIESLKKLISEKSA